ncbi:hypothetical protein POMI540_4596 [Schizosaccharomyces pombe]
MKRASLGGHAPVSLPSLNDDALEKKRAKENSRKQRELRRSSALHSITPRRESLNNSSPFNSSHQVPVLSNFEEWIKLATDNKINSTNTWNFALIDYFHDMSLLRDGEDINFQKASCTLDGCVKIYTSRIDSVATETGKLLSGLANDSKVLQQTEEGEDAENDDEDLQKKKERKRAQRSVKTLVKDFESIRAKKFELECSFDPLFKKMCADFDEDGAKGLLMNHLCVDQHGRIVFDSSDTVIKDLENKDVEAESQEAVVAAPIESHDTEMTNVHDNISRETLNGIYKCYFTDIDQLTICPSLQGFEFDSKGNLDVSLLKSLSDEVNMITTTSLVDNTMDKTDADAASLSSDSDGEEGHIVHALEEMAYDEENPYVDVLPKAMDESENPDFGVDTEVNMADGSTMNENYSIISTAAANGVYEYFDKSMKKNWAGPEHWRIQALRKNINNASTVFNSSNTAESLDNVSRSLSSTERKKRRELDNAIDFLQEVDVEALFTPATSSLKLPKSHWKRHNRCLLPDDYQYDSKRLLQLFLKPKMSVLPNADGEGQLQLNKALDDENDLDGIQPHGFDSDGSDNVDEGIPPYGFGDSDSPKQTPLLTPPSSSGFGDNLLLTARLAKPDMLNYAKRAKKVDVRVLKEKLWKCLDLENTIKENSINSHIEGSEMESEETNMPVKSFFSTVNQLEETYEKKELKDISTSFAFICVLHLANEHNLELTSNEDFSDVFIRPGPNLTTLEALENDV